MTYRKVKKDHIPVLAGGSWNPERFPELIHEVESGGTVLEFCQREGFSYASVWSWLNSVGDRWAQVQKAEQARRGVVSDIFIRELKGIAEADIRALYSKDGNLKTPNEWPPEVGRLVHSISYDKNGRINKVQFHSKLGGLQMIGKSLGLLDSSADKKLDTLAELLKSRQALLKEETKE